jgi:thiosulfate dehydrogenase
MKTGNHDMKKLLIILPALFVNAAYSSERAAASAVPTAAHPAEPSPGRFSPPNEADIPKNAFGDLVRRGQQLFVNTQQLRGRYVGNGLNCVNCHLDQGRLANSAPLWGAWPAYPAFRSKTGSVSSFEERMQGCFTYSMNGKAPPAGSPELAAMAAYAYWLATGTATGANLPGRLYPTIAMPKDGFDLARGAKVYAERCAICHGTGGEGRKVGDQYAMPPLWGKDSFNWGAGMHRVNTAAGFIKANMPLGQGGSLSDQEAWDVAAFVDSHERPQDPRFAGDIGETRARHHAADGVSLYGQTVNGTLLGIGTK